MKNLQVDEHLIEMIRSSQKTRNKAIAEITQRCMSIILSVLRRRGAQKEQSEAVYWHATAVMVSNIQSGKYQSQNKLCHYLRAIALNVLKHELRKENIRKGYEERIEIETEITNPEQLFLKEEKKQRLYKLLSKIKPGCKEVLTFWAMGFDMTEIAHKMGFKNSQIAMNKKSRCLKEAMTLLTKGGLSI